MGAKVAGQPWRRGQHPCLLTLQTFIRTNQTADLHSY